MCDKYTYTNRSWKKREKKKILFKIIHFRCHNYRVVLKFTKWPQKLPQSELICQVIQGNHQSCRFLFKNRFQYIFLFISSSRSYYVFVFCSKFVAQAKLFQFIRIEIRKWK